MTAMSSRDKPDHIGLRPECGICGHVMLPMAAFLTLFGNHDSTGFCHKSGAGNFIDDGVAQVETVLGRLCRIPSCRDCSISPEASTVHLDCFALFTRVYKSRDALDRLWVAAAWRYPWRQSPPLRLSTTAATVPFAVKAAAEMIGLERLKRLPQELWQIIRSYSESHVFWRYVSVLDFADQVASMPSEPAMSIGADQIARWERGTPPELDSDLTARSTLRLTMDSFGLRKVERILAHPPYVEGQFDDMAFVIEDMSKFTGATVQSKNGLVRLVLRDPASGLGIWDTPTPPALEQCSVAPMRTLRCMRFHTICFEKTTGLTFFIFDGKVRAIHAHTLRSPCARRTFDNLWNKRRIIWVYVPLATSNRLVAFGAQLKKEGDHYFTTDRPCYLLRTSLAGDTIVGRYQRGPSGTYDFELSKTPPSTLIYHAPEMMPISVMGAYSDTEGASDQATCAPYRHPEKAEPPFLGWHSSWAPLEHVSKVHVFYCDDGLSCRGLLFTYESGAQRALGQCRLQVDKCREYLSPSRFCSLSTTTLQPEWMEVDCCRGLQIVFIDGHEHTGSHSEDSWKCFSMTGTLYFYFSAEEAVITVEA